MSLKNNDCSINIEIKKVKDFWEENPLTSYEIKEELGSLDFFKEHDRIKYEDIDKYTIELHEFDKHQNEFVLDLGCGPGFFTRNYAKNNAKVVSVDLTFNAVKLVKKSFSLFNLKGIMIEANAENLPFKNCSFDFICCVGVLHHTPKTEQAIKEIYRVLKPKKNAIISIYYRNILLTKIGWHFTKFFAKLLLNSLPEKRRNLLAAESPEDFVRCYDGNENPLGKLYSKKEAFDLVNMFKIKKYSVHYFPMRFSKILNNLPGFIHKMLDKWLGVLIFLTLEK